ncbi:SusD/RagB family nutrient-binding outer membrane lipoprotein [Sphingobacterium humi]|uniref:SusD/RagB family nutrient-binding outer membrane lipoprotein n=1 Tax=Sphingobacterium humi TaxID=1796905 RepID=A0A6N8KZY0_9SPHI|nr:SusD/RagB family nutrient-binding outer membrane lipoprotein [Sphingobacterium humi]MVZ63030.1 SusD/RagB family nutrient-binding outer membrane lipoprotein [Sphingobacterium humi]
MKSIKNNILKISVIAFALTATSCEKFLDVNDTPNNPLEVPAATLLPTGLAGTAFANSNELNRFASTIMSVTAGAGGSPTSYDRYIIDGDDFGNQWNFELYGGALINYKKLIETAELNNSPAYAGIGKIMKAFTFAMATDIWGDVPYSEALTGDIGMTRPRLDAQKDIYLGNSTAGIQSLFDLVKEGLADLDKDSPLKPGSDDIVYGGKIENWKRAGNSLLLRLALQISSVEAAAAKTVIQDVITKNMFINANAANLSVKFGSQVGSQAPIWTLTHNSLFQNELIISTRFVDLLKGKKDPRLPLFVTNNDGAYVTIDNGYGGTLPAVGSRSIYNSYATGRDGEGPTRLLTYAQTSFILAEAVVRLGVTGDAQALYQQGIQASMQEAGVAAADITKYFAENAAEVALTGTNEQKIEKIVTQKYISLFSNGLEQWNDWRRTGYPVLTAHQNAGGIDGTRPVRAVYLFSEQQRNPNFPQGNTVPQSNVRVWWDAN